nr:MAG TPA: hypothetical protein [Bacteriophage sp.]
MVILCLELYIIFTDLSTSIFYKFNKYRAKHPKSVTR